MEKLKLKTFKLFIDGEWVEHNSGEYIESINPATLEVIAQFPRGNDEDIDKSVSVARKAFESSEWREMLPADRGRLLLKISQLIKENKDELMAIERLDTGQPRWLVEGGVELAARYFEYYSGVADKIQGESIPLRADFVDYTIREPLGVTAHIVPWNYPLQIAARSVSAALAAGNTVIVKPSEDTPLSALKLAEIATKAGLPKGVINVVTGYGNEAGQALVSHKGIDHITFTGSTVTGSNIMKSAGENIVSVTLELGGKSPQIVFSDADLEETAKIVVKSITQNSGQTCVAGSRLLVEKGIQEKFLQHINEVMDSLTLYSPTEVNYDISPTISEKQIRRVEEYMDIAIQEGCSIIRGGKRIEEGKLLFEPTLIDKLPINSRLCNEEIFGPVLVIQPFETIEEALEIANSTPYGLAAGIHTNNLNKAHWLANRIRAGHVYINNYGSPEGGVEMPFGGMGKSGIGSEKGLEALKHYTQVKNVAIKITSVALK
ncbi:MAG: aldehyde dehydrogenase family protein [Solibacillus sp.]